MTYLSLWKGQIPSRARVRDVLARVALEEGLPVSLLLTKTRRRVVAWPRQRVFYEAKREGRSYPEIARVFGMDHTTVLYGVRAYAARMAAE